MTPAIIRYSPATLAWQPVPSARLIHHAASRAWEHRPTGVVLLEFWFARDEGPVGAGHWEYEIRHAGLRMVVDLGENWHSRLEMVVKEILEP